MAEYAKPPIGRPPGPVPIDSGAAPKKPSIWARLKTQDVQLPWCARGELCNVGLPSVVAGSFVVGVVLSLAWRK